MTDFSAKYPPEGSGGGSGTVTEVDTGTGLTGGPITTTGTIELEVPVVVANGGTNSTAALNNNRVMKSAGGAIVEAAAIAASRALQSDANGIPVASTTTATELSYVNGVTSAIQTQLNAKQATLTPGNISTSTTGVTVGSGTASTVGPNVTVDVQTASGSQPGLLSAADWTTFNGKQAAGNYITSLTGGVTASGPGAAAATVAVIGGVTVSGATGTTNVVFSNSPTLVTPALGTPTSGVLSSCTGLPLSTGVTGTLALGNGGTGQTTKAAAFDALSPMTTAGDVIYGGTAGTGTRLAAGATGTVLHGGTTPSWSQIVNADVDPAAAIAGSKITAASSSAAGTVTREVTGSFTASFGNTSGPATDTWYYARVGNVVTVMMGSNTKSFTMTSSDVVAVSGAPASILPSTTVDGSFICVAYNGGAYVAANVKITTTTINLYRDLGQDGFANGTTSLLLANTFTYVLR